MAYVNRHPLAILTVLILSAILPGCDSDGPQGPAGPNLTGDLIGFVSLSDLSGIQSQDRSGVTVAVEGTGISAVTDSSGRWMLRNLPMGTYDIAFSKTGYGTKKSIGYQFVGGGQASYGTTSLSQLPGFTVTGLTATPSGDDITLSFAITGALPAANRHIRIFVGTSAAISSDPKNYRFVILGILGSTSTALSGSLPSQWFHSYGIPAGQTAYLIAYAEGYDSGAYIDPETGRNWYPNLNPIPSNIDTVAVP